ncbi:MULTISPECIES: N-acetylglucosamine-binding protein GbpA [Vibrio]|uniref:GlcNAc-binding protein A n=1 Tax=Vibrio mediterranei TaxID=689 RepID=A0A3G4VH88_9VIBR|nr:MULTISPECIES: N-acetylglucosamine-binding protein GbpA [Vibrio]AYV24197.1 N-acetylglucosamine-binding protein GbpA [Vibrio mediterranei]EDL55733.1 putative chitinase [Vibrio mediterranei AK1]MDA0106739.1 N-acetylglucosamine-binding protein GbpA [Vibrio sp. La 4.2.2]USE03077.1 N-acetylglucosamine-binding protein GbpA [Vibrio sp. SCSIO 43133]
MKQTRVLLSMAALGLVASPLAYSHGYVSAVESGVAEARATLCKYPADTGEKNVNCGSVQWEPQSVEGPEGFPQAGPPDGQIASAGLTQFSPLNEQTSDRWVKRPIQSGMQTFEWTFTANHVTKDWKYYITKPNWNPNQALTRDSFDLNPFCVVEGNMQKPPKLMSHQCNVPEREGYQIVLAVWDVGDTAAAFYNVIDVQFNGDNPGIPGWSQAGTINPTMDLKVGDSVFTRVFDSNGELPNLSTSITITSEQQGQANQWSHALATQINHEHTDIKAGQQDSNGNISPVYGSNTVYVADNSGLDRVEIGYDIVTPPPSIGADVTGLEPEYQIGETPVELTLNVAATGNVDVSMNVYNHAQESLASQELSLADGENQNVTLILSKSEAGHHMLVTRVRDDKGNLVDQTTQDFMLVEQTIPGDYDFVFPDGLSQYTEGTKVLAKDGHIYQCKPFPNSGYCVQWSPTATQFEPGVGSHWTSAWNKLN